jgi:peptide-methionine (S)-S-oxide reductase
MRMKTTLVPVFAATVVLATAVLGWQERARLVPPPSLDPPATGRTSDVAVLAGGCFWGVQGVYQHVKGVTNAVSGYAGGDKSTAVYDRVGSGNTGHAEAVAITFDPREISYGRLLQVFFSVVHDPTQLNRQGPDEGSHYRSAIFPLNADQEAVARAYVNQLQIARTFSTPVVTKLEPGKTFYRAEDYHQDYLERHPADPYITINDLPKIRDLQRLFPELYRNTPVLVRKSFLPATELQ